MKQLQNFIGLCYSKFQNNYSYLTHKFYHLLSKKNKWKWIEDNEITFTNIKKRYLSCIMLLHTDFDKVFYLNCDTSGVSLVSVLYHETENGENIKT